MSDLPLQVPPDFCLEPLDVSRGHLIQSVIFTGKGTQVLYIPGSFPLKRAANGTDDLIPDETEAE